MKQKFVMKGKGDFKTKITVELEVKAGVFTRWKQQNEKKRLENAIHTLLVSRGYNVSDIIAK